MIRGRARELGILDAALDASRVEHATPLLVIGDAGMGKTALLDAVARRARSNRLRIVRAAAPDGAQATAFGIVEDIARGLADVVARLPEADAAVLRAPGRVRAEGPGPVATALLHALAEAAHQQPLLVLLDDLHWADTGSLAALCLAVGRLQIEPVAVIGAARPRPPLDPRLQAWRQVDVGPLDVEAAVAVLSSVLPDGLVLEPGQARRVVSALGGCPLAIVECPRLLTTDQLTGASALPDLIHLDDHLLVAWGGAWEALPAPTRTALVALCVTQGAKGGLLDRLLADLGLSPDDLDTARCDRLVTIRSTPSGTDLALAHPLIRDAVLAAAGPAAVRAMHRTAAQAATALGLAPSIAIAHLEASAMPGDAEVAAQLVAHADRALADDLAESAVRALTAAASLTQSDPERTRIAARAARTVLSRSLGMADSQRILALIDPRVLPEDEGIWVEYMRVERLGDVSMAEHLAAMSALAGRAMGSGSPLIPWLLISAIDAAWRLQDRSSMLALADSLRTWADREDPDAPVMVPAWACRAVHAVCLFQAGEVARAHAELTATRAESERWRPHPDQTVEQLIAALVVESVMGQPDPWVDARLEYASWRWLGDPGETLAWVRQLQAERSRRRGELGVARALSDEALSLLRASRARGLELALAAATLISATLGAREVLDRESAELRDRARLNGDRQVITIADRAEGLLALGEGRLDDALLHLEPLSGDLLLGRGPWDAVPMGRADLVEALVRSGELTRAAEVAADLARTLGPSPDPCARAIVARTRGLVDSNGEARPAFEAAIAEFREAGDPFEEARTQLLLGQLLRRRRQVQQARHALRVAASAFDRMGAAPWVSWSLAELRATGADVPRSAAGPWSRLTPQEQRVAAAVAAGGSNRQVAGELFLSDRTVGYHLASIYRKLGVTNRTELAARLAHARGAPDFAQAGPG